MISRNINGIELFFDTTGAPFSPLNIDTGTLAMLSFVDLAPPDKVLDLGCGYGVAGIYAARIIGEQSVFMSDIDKKCLELSKANAEANGVGGIRILHSDGFRNIKERDFTLILSNPPYHTDFSVPRHFIEKGFNRLKTGGKMIMVTKRKAWYKNKLIAIFGGTEIHEVDGYYVFCAEKRRTQYARTKTPQNSIS